TRRNRDVDPTQFIRWWVRASADRAVDRHVAWITGRRVRLRRADGETVRVGRDRREIDWASAARHRSFINTVRAVLIEIVLHRRRNAAHSDRGENARNAVNVRQLKAGNVLTLTA